MPSVLFTTLSQIQPDPLLAFAISRRSSVAPQCPILVSSLLSLVPLSAIALLGAG